MKHPDPPSSSVLVRVEGWLTPESDTSCLLAFYFHGAVLDQTAVQPHAVPSGRRLSPFESSEICWLISLLKYGAECELSATRSASQADSLQLANHPKLFNRKVIISEGTGTRSLLIYNESLCGEASKIGTSWVSVE